MTVAGLVLAAGEGRRFGGPKAVALLAGERLVDRAVRTLTEAGCSPVVVVSGAVDLEVPGARVVANPLWRTGMGSSLRAGLADLAGSGEPGDAEVEAAVVFLVDTPWLTADAVRRLVELGSAAAGSDRDVRRATGSSGVALGARSGRRSPSSLSATSRRGPGCRPTRARSSRWTAPGWAARATSTGRPT